VKWGCDLQSEHERYITEEAFGGCPVIIRDYPKACYFSPSFSVHYVQAAVCRKQ
jgi:aspartyl/asparaginyl-tRNA synthetase